MKVDRIVGMKWKNSNFAVLFGIQFLVGFSFSEKAPDFSFIRDAISAPAVLFYDYIIIGGGTAGCPLAATLSQGSRVLVLERGDSPYSNPNITDLKNFAIDLADTSPDSFAQQFISRDGVLNARARVLGGGSVLNAGFYSRAESSFIKEAGLNETLVMESYQWVEKKVVFQPQVLQWQSAVRAGLIEAGVVPDNGFTYDHLYGTKIGGTIFDKEGHRHSAADLLENANPRRIFVYLHATVQKIFFKYSQGARPKAYGVLFGDKHGMMHKALLSRKGNNEIILSAGAIGSPQMLMLSGIGPAHHLRAHGIRTVLDNPTVGQGMADNPMNAIVIPSPEPVEDSLIQPVGITKFGSYIEAASGIRFGDSWPERLRSIFEMLSNQTGLPAVVPPDDMSRDIRYINFGKDAALNGGVILEKINGPLSKGYLELLNTNPSDNPLVTFNYFKEPEDLYKCVKGMKVIISVINSRAFSRYRYPKMSVEDLIQQMLKVPMNLRPKHARAAHALEQYCIDTVLTIWHYHGGCLPGKVVDNEYKVIGVDSLRVIDGSTFTSSPGTNPQATVLMLGRYMGQQILRKRCATYKETTS